MIRATLRNGLKVVIVRNTLAPVVTTMVNYLVGSVEAPQGFPGMAHAQEHMMFRGSPGLSADQLAAIIAAMGGKFNADTQQTITQYFLTVPSADLDTALRVEAIRMRGVLDSEQLWAKERGAIEQEVAQDYSNPEFVFYMKVLAAMFKGTPYEESPLGSVASFDKTTGGALKKFFETWYAPNNAVLVIVGDVDPARALAATKRYFDLIPRKRIPARPEVHLRPVKPETLRLKTDESIWTGHNCISPSRLSSPDYPACRVLADALSNQRSRLFELVPGGQGPLHGIQPGYPAPGRPRLCHGSLPERGRPGDPRRGDAENSGELSERTASPLTWWRRPRERGGQKRNWRRIPSSGSPWHGPTRSSSKEESRRKTRCGPSSTSPWRT